MKKTWLYHGYMPLVYEILRKMKLTVFFLCLSVLGSWAIQGYSQTTRLTVNIQNSSIRQILNQIEEQSEYRFFYSGDLNVEEKKSISQKDKAVADILEELFRDSNVNYRIQGRQIALFVNEGENSLATAIQQKQVGGKVIDQSGQSLPGVAVLVKGTTNGTITDSDGNYSLSNVPSTGILVFSFVGMKPYEVTVGNQSTINVSLSEETIGIEEVVAIGYGVQKKVNLTGSVAVIDNEVLANRPVTSVSTAIQGLLPGATVIQNSGQPGKDMATIRIRGIGTLNNSNPMYVVDGMIVGSINDIDPNDIESISILKDAASAAIYGSRASNGVVLVTTKKGTQKSATLKYDGYAGVQTPTNMLEYLPSWEYAQLYNQARINQNLAAAYTEAEIQKFKDGSDPDNYPNTDWLGMFYKKNGGFQQSHRVELTGGANNTSYMFSLGYFNQDGIIENSDFKRYNARMNLSTTFNKITASLNMAFTYGITHEPTNPYTGDMYQIFRQINRISPWVPYKYSNGYYGYINDGNPLAWMDLDAVRNQQYRKTRGIGNVTYEPIKGLKFQEVLGYEYTGSSDEKFIKDIQYYNWKTGSPTLYQGPNSQKESRTDDQMISLQSLATYDKTFGKHSFSILAGYSQELFRQDWNSSYRKGFLNNELTEINAGSTDGQEAEGSAYEYALQSFFGRISYDFDHKYLFEANIRRDGTSRIAKEHRWGTFPSFSGAWRIINEPFMSEMKNIVSDMKVRAGWGILGNQNIGNYPYQSVLSSGNYDFGGTIYQGVALANGVNQGIKWESSKTTNIGIDLGFFANKLTVTADMYNRKTYDILMKLPVPTPFGLSAPYQNAGEIMNKGIEMQVGYKFALDEWKFDILANASYNKNEIINLHNDGARIWDGYSFLQEGYPVNSFGGYIAEGLFRTQEDLDASAVPNRSRAGLGDIKYKNMNDDEIINAADRDYLGSWIPAWTFGSSLGVKWKNFNVDLLLQGAAKVKGYTHSESVGSLEGFTGKPTTIFRDTYDKNTNPNGNFPRALTSWTQNSSYTYPSSFWIVDTSYLRLKNLQVGYTIPSRICNSIGIANAKIYYSGQNLLTISGLRKGFDPEAPAGARAYYPQVKTSTIGLSVTF